MWSRGHHSDGAAFTIHGIGPKKTHFLTRSINFTVDDRSRSMARSLQPEGGQVFHAHGIGPVLTHTFYGFGLLPVSLDENQSFSHS